MRIIIADIVRKEIKELGKDFAAKTFALLEDIKRAGLSKLPPYRKKKLTREIWELRVSGKDGIARTLYASIEKDTLHILVSFVKKKQETPLHYIKLANERLSRLRKETYP